MTWDALYTALAASRRREAVLQAQLDACQASLAWAVSLVDADDAGDTGIENPRVQADCCCTLAYSPCELCQASRVAQ